MASITTGSQQSQEEKSEESEAITSNHDSYQAIKIIGHCFDAGRVLLATSKKCTALDAAQSELVAVKQYSLEHCQRDIGLFLKEVWLMKHLKHGNIITCIESFVLHHSLHIITPLCNYGSALDLIQSHFYNGFPEPVIAGILRDVLQALDYMHSKGYIHRSIRASHILISSEGQALLSGLKDAYCIVEKGRWQRAVYDYPSKPERSFCWLSPELLRQNLRGYDEKSDIYSLGITACELANGIAPFVDLSSTQLLISKLQGSPPQIWDCNTIPPTENRIVLNDQAADSGVFDGVTANSHIETRLESAFQRCFSRPFHRFTMLCVQHEPTLRPAAMQLLKHTFIQSTRKGSNTNWIEYFTCVPLLSSQCELDTSISSEHQVLDHEDVMWDFV